MRRAQLNFIVDAIVFAGFVLLAATGGLIRYVLPPGTGQTSTLWGMNRHGWGSIHFWLAVVVIVAVIVHLILHWQWIVRVVRGPQQARSGWRVALAVVGVVVLPAIAGAPFFGTVERTGEAPHKVRSAEYGLAPCIPRQYLVE